MGACIIGLGRNNVFRWDAPKSRWLKMVENIEMPRDTLIYGELVQELRGQGRSQMRSHALHIIDAIYLGGVDVSQLHLNERQDRYSITGRSVLYLIVHAQ